MRRNIIFLEQYTSEYQDETYEIFKFIDEVTLKILFGTNLTENELEEGKTYKGTLAVKSYKGKDKVKVISIEE